ncbi:ferritin light chain-like [Mya arenaria]|uniref:ferritin light chain-like n=1 Tax=Mya arenaria TaxID=6604 RepID=UPI0022E61452|nr:ferritin light chain-like [Mya arenaria]
MAEERNGTFSLLVLVVVVAAAVLWIPDVPGVHSQSATEDSKLNIRARAIRKYKTKDDERYVSPVKFNWDDTVNRIISKTLVTSHLSASYQYLYMANYFDRSDVALPGFSSYFRKASDREMKNANSLLTYVNKRGGYHEFRDIEHPEIFTFVEEEDLVRESLGHALRIENDLYYRNEKMHTRARKINDPHLTHFIEDNFLDQKVNVIKELKDHLGRLSYMATSNYGLAVYLYDRDM